jgi:hypothetical protein
MCFVKTPTVTPAATAVASTYNPEAQAAGDLEASLRKMRAGAAANILTSPTGIPYTKTLGGVA